MATVRAQTLPNVPYKDSGSPPTGNVSLGRSTNFGNLWMAGGGTSGPQLIGGLQSFHVEETNGTSWRPSGGSDWLEPVYGPRMWQGEGQRFQIRSEDLQQQLSYLYPSASDIDFRYLPFLWQYQFNYTNITANQNIENAQWSWMTVIIIRYRWAMPNANDLLSEDFSFIGKGISRSDNGTQISANPSTLWAPNVSGVVTLPTPQPAP